MKDLNKFIASVDSDIAWRKKEISNIILMHNENNSELIVKASVLFIYSHWEGCVKSLCKLYLGYVSNLSIKISDLTDNYKAIKLKGKIKQMVDSSESLTMTNELSFIKSINNYSADIFSDTDKSIINTKSNLNYKIFVSLLKIIGLVEKDCLLTKEVYIDEKLLQNRNKIAHGNKIDSFNDEFDLDIESIKKTKDLIFSIIDSLASDLKFYAENEYYLSANEGKIEEYNESSNNDLELKLDRLFI